MCNKTSHIFLPLSDVSLTVIVGLNSRTIIVIVRRVWVCPLPCSQPSTGSFVYILVLKDWLFSSTLLYISNVF